MATKLKPKKLSKRFQSARRQTWSNKYQDIETAIKVNKKIGHQTIVTFLCL